MRSVFVKKITAFTTVLAILSTVLLSACGPNTPQTAALNGSTGSDAVKVVYPEKTNEILDNPGMGWVVLEEPNYQGHTDLGNSGNFPEASYISLSTAWAQVEKTEGVYDWSEIDRTIDYWKGQGKKVIMRLCTDTLQLGYTRYGAPKYLFDKYNIPYTNRANWGEQIKMPDITNPIYLEKLKAFLANMAAKFNDDDTVPIIELRGYGLWGEWHSGCDFADYDARYKALTNIIDLWHNAFSENKVLVVCAAYEYDNTMTPYVATQDSYEQYLQVQAYNYALKYKNVTFRCDSGGGLIRYDSNGRAVNDVRRSGKEIPLLAEYGSSYGDAVAGKTGFDNEESLNDILFKLSPNFCTVMGWVAPVFKQYLEKEYPTVEKGERLLGYRLNIEQASFPAAVAPGGKMTVSTAWTNSAMGRMWQDYNLSYYLLDDQGNAVSAVSDKDINFKQFVNGSVYHWSTDFKLADDVKEGTYRLAAALTDKEGTPAIRLGIAGNDGKLRYVLGTVKVAKGTKTEAKSTPMTKEQMESFTFKANQTYQVSFKYKSGFKSEDFKFADTGSYHFQVESKSGGKGATVGVLNWQDVSGNTGVQTVTFTTQKFGDYKAAFGSDKFGDITFNEFTVTEMNGAGDDFESGSFSGIIKAANSNYAKDAAAKNVIGGKYSAMVRTKGKGDTDALKTDTGKYPLKVSTSYTVSYRFKAISDVGNGGYYYLNLNSKDGKTKTNVGMWYERSDAPAATYTYTFRTAQEDGQYISWGIHNGSSCYIDDVTIVEQPAGGTVTKGEEQKHAKNQPLTLNQTFPLKEGFEAGSFYGSYFLPGWNNNGHFTNDPKKVISGQWSLLGEPEYYMDWIEYANTDANLVKLKAGGAYRIKFNYRITKEPVASDGFFYLLARSATGGQDADKGFTRFNGKVGETGSKDVYIQLGDQDDYQIVFGLFKYGGIVVDDVQIEEAAPLKAFKGSIDFESGKLDNSYVTDGFTSGEGAVITSDKDLVIDGKYSVFAINDKNKEWYEYLYTDPSLVKLKPNTAYTVQFDYRVVKTVGASGFFNFFVRSEKGGNADVGSITWTGKVGETGTKTVTFTTKNYKDYKLIFGIHNQGGIVIDNIKLK